MWRDQPRGHPEGAAGPEGCPQVDPNTNSPPSSIVTLRTTSHYFSLGTAGTVIQEEKCFFALVAKEFFMKAVSKQNMAWKV